MSKAPMKATPANVSRLLTAADHQKRTAYPSAIRGMKNYSNGFKCEAADGLVVVRHMVDGYYDPSPASAKRARVEYYLPALKDHFACEVVEQPPGSFYVAVRPRSEPTP